MEITKIHQQSFTSLANPIKPYKIETKLGILDVHEVTKEELQQHNFIRNITNFFSNNFASSSEDPCWLMLKREPKSERSKQLQSYLRKYWRSKIKSNDKNTTLLLAKNKDNKLCGACLSFGYDEVPTAKDTTCYIDSIVVSKKYRGYNVGKSLLEKTLESAQKSFNDVFLTGEKTALGFYKKLGFTKLNVQSKSQKNVIDFIAEDRSDYPYFVSLLTKPLNKFKPRWYNVASPEIEKLNNVI
ncbi:MAG: GNAT family N-acetyltransferase [Clostridiaceae bacterium]|jgi:ribosomal protein S18 acetylase RimI-like enzyme|nr:GNAT family N-acetyltransferase [Clostridiaceae bacterium]